MITAPEILFEDRHSVNELNDLRRNRPIWQEHDIYEAQLKEYFEITNPELIESSNFTHELSSYVTERTLVKANRFCGNWIYFPWNGELIHTIGEIEYMAIRTNRNRNLITSAEQAKLLRANIGLIGLSVGSNIASALVYSGIGACIKMADFDRLETSNFNRIRANLTQIGLAKIDVIAQQIYEINPYINLELFPSGINDEVISEFIISEPKPNIIFEIIDSFEMKIRIRQLARQHTVPVIMVTNLGDRTLIDVERYDLDQQVPFFNGRAGTVPDQILNFPDLTVAAKHHYAVQLAGPEHIPIRALQSVEQIGKTLVGRPQLGSTVTAATAFCTYLARKILLGEPVPSGSWLIDLDTLFAKSAAL